MKLALVLALLFTGINTQAAVRCDGDQVAITQKQKFALLDAIADSLAETSGGFLRDKVDTLDITGATTLEKAGGFGLRTHDLLSRKLVRLGFPAIYLNYTDLGCNGSTLTVRDLAEAVIDDWSMRNCACKGLEGREERQCLQAFYERK